MHPTKLGRIWLAEIFRAEEMGGDLGGGNEHREWNFRGGKWLNWEWEFLGSIESGTSKGSSHGELEHQRDQASHWGLEHQRD
jgi:hypothetical protein